MKNLIIISALLMAMTSCEKDCHNFKCSQSTTTYDKFGAPSTSVQYTDIEKCDISNKDAKNFIKSMNGKLTSTSGNIKVTVSTNCTIAY
jgi:hypothetical protein